MKNKEICERSSNYSRLCKFLSKVHRELRENRQANNGNAERGQTKVQLGTRAEHSVRKSQTAFYDRADSGAFLPRVRDGNQNRCK